MKHHGGKGSKMTEQISLDDSSYEGLYERAVARLKEQAPWWTHQEVSDPGITLIEMWATLVDMQSYYLDQIQEAHYRKYLKLLGVDADEGECATAWVFLDGVTKACAVPCGTKLCAEEMIFETQEEVKLTPNRLIAFYPEGNRNRITVMNIFRKSRFALQQNQEEVLFSFALKDIVEAGEELCLYVLLDERRKRNPAGQDFCMAQLAWEYRTQEGWKEANILRDDTRGLLYSGIVCLQPAFAGIHSTENGYIMRCRIKAGAYDVLPVLYKIYLNAIQVVQKNTLCCEETAEIPIEGGRVELKSYLAKTGSLQVLCEEGESTWRDITADCTMEPPITALRKERFLVVPDIKGKDNDAMTVRIKIICTAEGTAEEYLPCPVTGVSSQRISLPWENLMRNSVELMLCGGGGIYRMYRRTQAGEERYANAWHWQEGKNVIVLGDGRHGDIPEPSGDGLRLTSLVLWEAEKGNISIGRITRWEKPELFPGILCTNHLAGSGGRKAKKPSEQFNEISKVLRKVNRMVTHEDVKTLVKETPGLLIQDVKAEWRAGTVAVTIFPAVPLKNKDCRQKYEKEVAMYLEKFRLAGSRIEVTCDCGQSMDAVGTGHDVCDCGQSADVVDAECDVWI